MRVILIKVQDSIKLIKQANKQQNYILFMAAVQMKQIIYAVNFANLYQCSILLFACFQDRTDKFNIQIINFRINNYMQDKDKQAAATHRKSALSPISNIKINNKDSSVVLSAADKQRQAVNDSTIEKKRNGQNQDQRNYIKKVLKDKLSLSNINDLVLCDIEYNYGLFGCINSDQEQFPGATCASGVTSAFASNHKDDAQHSMCQAFKPFNQSSNTHSAISNNGPLGYLAELNQQENYQYSSAGYNLLGYSAIKKKDRMTEYQRNLTEYFEQLRSEDPQHFTSKTKI